MNGIIYRYTAPNGKHYIGQTTDENERKRRHKMANARYGIFHKAIKEYGYDSFEYTVLHSGIDNFDDLNRLEQEEITRHNSISPNGYNLRSGGHNGFQSEETKNKIKKSVLDSYEKRTADGYIPPYHDDEDFDAEAWKHRVIYFYLKNPGPTGFAWLDKKISIFRRQIIESGMVLKDEKDIKYTFAWEQERKRLKQLDLNLQ